MICCTMYWRKKNWGLQGIINILPNYYMEFYGNNFEIHV
jgi:hypothetical protein